MGLLVPSLAVPNSFKHKMKLGDAEHSCPNIVTIWHTWPICFNFFSLSYKGLTDIENSDA